MDRVQRELNMLSIKTKEIECFANLLGCAHMDTNFYLKATGVVALRIEILSQEIEEVVTELGETLFPEKEGWENGKGRDKSETR